MLVGSPKIEYKNKPKHITVWHILDLSFSTFISCGIKTELKVFCLFHPGNNFAFLCENARNFHFSEPHFSAHENISTMQNYSSISGSSRLSGAWLVSRSVVRLANFRLWKKSAWNKSRLMRKTQTHWYSWLMFEWVSRCIFWAVDVRFKVPLITDIFQELINNWR